LPALHSSDSGDSGVWEYFGENFFRQDCFNILYLDWGYINFIIAHLFHEADGAVVTRRGSTLVIVVAGKERGDYQGASTENPD
jgi:hypothetical protein